MAKAINSYLPNTLPPLTEQNPTVLRLGDWRRGLNTVRKNVGLRLDELADVLNLKYFATPYGIGLTSREGVVRQTASAVAPYAIKDLGFYQDASGNQYIMAVCNSKLYQVNPSTFTATLVGSLESSRGRGVQMANKWLIADGGHLKYWDGTTFSVCWDDGSYSFDWRTASPAGSVGLYAGNITRAGGKITAPIFAAGTIPHATAEVYLSKTGAPTGTITVKCYAADGTTALGSYTMDCTGLTTSPLKFTCPLTAASGQALTVASGVVRYIVVEFSGGDSSNTVNVHYASAASGGTWLTYNASWSAVDTAKNPDFAFASALPPKSSMLEVFANRLWINDRTAGRLNWLWYSQLNNPFNWTGTSIAGYLIMDVGLEITALKSYYTNLFVHFGTGRKAVYVVDGTTPSTFTASLAVPGAGAINADCAWSLQNDFLFLDTAGLVSIRQWKASGNLEGALRSGPVSNILVPSVAASTSFGGVCYHELQAWVSVAQDYLLVYDGQIDAWTKYQFGLGTGVAPTAIQEINGETWVGDSAGHLWKQSVAAPVYYDGPAGGLAAYPQYMRTGFLDFGTLRRKRAGWANAVANSRFGGVYDLMLYVDSIFTPQDSVPVSMAMDEDVTLDEATMTLNDATFSLNGLASSLMEQEINIEFTTLAVGIENISTTGYPIVIHGVSLDAALLPRI